MNRTVKLGLVSVVAAVVTLGLLALFWMLVNGIGSGPQSAAESFFAGVAANGPQAGYATTSPAFQRSTPLDTFVATVQASQLGSYQSSSWTRTRNAEANQAGVADLNGVITLKGGGAIPAKLGLVKGEGGWSVLSLNLPAGGLSGGEAAQAPTPSDQTAAPQAANDTQAMAPQAEPQAQAEPQSAPPPQASERPAGNQASFKARSRRSAIVVTSHSVAGICGRDILRHGRVETLDVHCVHGLSAAPGSTAQCIADINGHRQGVAATLKYYDPVSGKSDVSCRPED